MTKEEIEKQIEDGATRKCKSCNETLPVTSFFIKKDPNNKYYRFNSPCKECSNANRNASYQKAYQIKTKYNMTSEEYKNMLIAQEYSCDICGIHRDDCSKDFSVDHCHSSGNVRGLLCQSCNIGLGNFRDSIKIMKNAIAYIKKSK